MDAWPSPTEQTVKSGLRVDTPVGIEDLQRGLGPARTLTCVSVHDLHCICTEVSKHLVGLEQ